MPARHAAAHRTKHACFPTRAPRGVSGRPVDVSACRHPPPHAFKLCDARPIPPGDTGSRQTVRQVWAAPIEHNDGAVGLMVQRSRLGVRGSGRRHSHTATVAMIALPMEAIHHVGAVRNRMPAQNTIMIVATRLERRLTAPCVCQSWIIGPKRRCASSHACKRSEPRAAAKAESNTNGIVGRPGTTIPTMPSPKLVYARSHHAQRQRRKTVTGTGVPAQPSPADPHTVAEPRPGRRCARGCRSWRGL